MGEVARPWTTKEPSSIREQRRPGGTSPGVCRNLFGTFDRDENSKYVREELALIAERECQKWNFDFKEEKPKKGRFEWTLATDDIDGGNVAPSREKRYLAAGTSGGDTGHEDDPQRLKTNQEEMKTKSMDEDDPQRLKTNQEEMKMKIATDEEDSQRLREERGLTITEERMKTQSDGGREKIKRGTCSSSSCSSSDGSSPTTSPIGGNSTTQKQITDFLRKRKNTVTKKLTSSSGQPQQQQQQQQHQQSVTSSSETDIKIKRRAST